jgi:hypothetical protein
VDRDQAVKALNDIAAGMRDAFPAATDRLAQLDSHIATAVMVVEHIVDESARADASKE